MNSVQTTKPQIVRVKIGGKFFNLDKQKAEEAYEGKRVINGIESQFFNILPIKYQWAYDMYKTMKANHWEPEDIPMQKDIEQWKDKKATTEEERWIIKMGIGYFSAAEGIIGDNVIHSVRDKVTASELKLVLGRHAQEENIHADSLVYMISSIGLNPHECETIFRSIPSVFEKADFVVKNSRDIRGLKRFETTEEKQMFAQNIFLYGQCMEGTQFYGLFAMILSMFRRGKFVGIGQMFSYVLRDELSHVTIFRKLLEEIISENPEVWTPVFKNSLRETMRKAVDLEKEFIKDCMPKSLVGLTQQELFDYIDYLGDTRLASLKLDPLNEKAHNPLDWMSQTIEMKKEQNFFEGRVTEYQKASSLPDASDEDL